MSLAKAPLEVGRYYTIYGDDVAMKAFYICNDVRNSFRDRYLLAPDPTTPEKIHAWLNINKDRGMDSINSITYNLIASRSIDQIFMCDTPPSRINTETCPALDLLEPLLKERQDTVPLDRQLEAANASNDDERRKESELREAAKEKLRQMIEEEVRKSEVERRRQAQTRQEQAEQSRLHVLARLLHLLLHQIPEC